MGATVGLASGYFFPKLFEHKGERPVKEAAETAGAESRAEFDPGTPSVSTFPIFAAGPSFGIGAKVRF